MRFPAITLHATSSSAPVARSLLAGLAIGFLNVAGLGFQPALSSTVVVPDDFSTVQPAIDTGADTVLIRQGTYQERPVVDHALTLRGIGVNQRPTLAGLAISNSNFWAVPPLLSVRDLGFRGSVDYTTLSVAPRNLTLRFASCSLDSGVRVTILDTEDIGLLDIRSSYLDSQSMGIASTIRMDADTIDGGVSWNAGDVSINDCWFRGGGGPAIALHTGELRGASSHNRIEHYDTGIYIEDIGSACSIDSNVISRCGTGILIFGGYSVDMRGNYIHDCVTGIEASVGLASVVGNRILRASGNGVTAYQSDFFVADNNVVGDCGGSGIWVDWQDGAYAGAVRENTVFRNLGTGIELAQLPGSVSVDLRGNIGFKNRGWGLKVSNVGTVELGCNDWFGNGLGGVTGAADSTDLSVDPLFCNVDSADVRLDSASPLLADSANCGQIGALGVGCGETPTLVQRFTASRVSGGVRVVWQVADGATASAIWVERAEGATGLGWTQPVMERSVEGATVVELDRSALPDHAYRYRLVARDGGKLTVLDPGILVEAQAPLVFALGAVGPSPGGGPVRIAFTLAHDAAIQIDVFDLLGRKVATPAQGVWPAGTQVVAWDGQTRGGQPAPAGMYLVRYTFPGGQERRRVMRFR